MSIEWELEDDEAGAAGSEFRTAVSAGRYDEARALIDERLADSDWPRWLVTSMLEDLGLSLAHAGRYDESIVAFERALELGWDVVPDGRCEIARVLLLAGRHAEADALWSELRDADRDGVWTLNAGGFAYGEAGRDEEAAERLAEGLRVAMDRDDPERVVDQMSDARRVSLGGSVASWTSSSARSRRFGCALRRASRSGCLSFVLGRSRRGFRCAGS